MAINLGTANLEPNLSNGNVGVRVAQIAKEQQKVEGDIALRLIDAAAPEAAPTPVGNTGHNIDIKA